MVQPLPISHTELIHLPCLDITIGIDNSWPLNSERSLSREHRFPISLALTAWNQSPLLENNNVHALTDSGCARTLIPYLDAAFVYTLSP